jgi:hypothetical protein
MKIQHFRWNVEHSKMHFLTQGINISRIVTLSNQKFEKRYYSTMSILQSQKFEKPNKFLKYLGAINAKGLLICLMQGNLSFNNNYTIVYLGTVKFNNRYI